MVTNINAKLAKRAAGQAAGLIPIIGDVAASTATATALFQDYQQFANLKALQDDFAAEVGDGC
jgi:hypothetical protein